MRTKDIARRERMCLAEIDPSVKVLVEGSHIAFAFPADGKDRDQILYRAFLISRGARVCFDCYNESAPHRPFSTRALDDEPLLECEHWQP